MAGKKGDRSPAPSMQLPPPTRVACRVDRQVRGGAARVRVAVVGRWANRMLGARRRYETHGVRTPRPRQRCRWTTLVRLASMVDAGWFASRRSDRVGGLREARAEGRKLRGNLRPARTPGRRPPPVAAYATVLAASGSEDALRPRNQYLRPPYDVWKHICRGACVPIAQREYPPT